VLQLRDLALRSDFQLGPIRVSPSRRLVEGPAGKVHLEPLIMQVFLLLLDHDGQVVTRKELFDQCWGGVMVGDDSLNRAVAKVRRIAGLVAPGIFEIETIPRTGYRLSGEIVELLQAPAEAGLETDQSDHLSRRAVIGLGGAGVVLAAGGAAWWIDEEQDRRFEALVRKGNEALRGSIPLPDGISALQQAVTIRPRSAQAWGLLGLLGSFAAQAAAPNELEAAAKRAEDATLRALAIDPREPNALLAMYELQGSTLDWIARDRRLRQVIAVDPKNVSAIAELVMLLQAVGLTRESWDWNERAIAMQPLSSDFLGKRALKLWILGRVPQADKVADQLLDMYPSVPWVFWIRFVIYALTGRAKAAQALMNSERDKFAAPTVQFWSRCLPALDQPTPEAVAEARRSCFEASRDAAQLATNAVMILSALRQVDAAFDVATGFLLSRGPVVRRGKSTVGSDSSWRVNTQWLFTPPCAVMRADPRFLPLCDGVGLTDYWRSRGVEPDFMRT